MAAGPKTRILAASVLLAAGCSAYDSQYAFEPGPVDVPAAVPGSDAEPARTLVSVVGVFRHDKQLGIPRSVEVRLRVENTSPAEVRLDPSSVALFSAGLERFPDPIVQPPRLLQVAPGDSEVLTAWFPFPEGLSPSDMDLSGLNVRWTLMLGDQPVTSSASFVRRPSGYYERYPYRVGVGYQAYCY